MSRPPVLEARHIVKELGDGAGKVLALKGVTLTLFPGELTLLMGPSGSGKTTLLSILGCILAPTSGSLTVAGNPTVGLGPEQLAALRRKHVGFIFQSYNLFPTLTALDNVRLALDVSGFSAAECKLKAEAALRKVGLGHRLNSYPGTLSGGEKQRVAIARALAGAPAVILADEPTSALDGENGQSVMGLLSAIAKDKQRAVLAVTHDPRTIPFADRIVNIEDGLIIGQRRAVEVGSVSQLRAGPVRHAEPGNGAAKQNNKRKRKANV